MTDVERCKKHVYSQHRFDFRGHRCRNAAKKDGYCNVHHPDAEKERDRKSSERRSAKQADSPITILSKRVKELEAIIEMLPHGDECLLVFNTITDRWEIETCNCPKSKIGSK